MKNRKTLYAVAGFLLLAAALTAAYFFVLRSDTTPGAKTIHVTVVKDEGAGKTIDIHTDAEYLRQALEEKDLIAGDESAFGLYVKTVDGLTADEEQQQWWRFTKGGEELFTGVDATPIEDGDSFEITLSVW